MPFTCILGWVFQFDVPGYTRLELSRTETGTRIFSSILHDGDPVVFTWRNSLFKLDVTEVFIAESGQLIQTQVTFADPRGLPPPTVDARDVNDLYQTGGAFSAQGMRRPFNHIAYRVGEIGNPKMKIGSEVVDFKQQVGFGGGIDLRARTARLYQLLLQIFE